MGGIQTGSEQGARSKYVLKRLSFPYFTYILRKANAYIIACLIFLISEQICHTQKQKKIIVIARSVKHSSQWMNLTL